MTPVWQKAEAQRCHRQSRGFPRPSRCSSTSWRTVMWHGEHSNPVWSSAFREVFKFSKQVFFGRFADSSYDYHPADPNMVWAPQLKEPWKKNTYTNESFPVFQCWDCGQSELNKTIFCGICWPHQLVCLSFIYFTNNAIHYEPHQYS